MTEDRKEFDMGELVPELKGVKAIVLPDAEIAQSGALIVCARVARKTSRVVAGSIQMECSLCHAKVWVSPASQKILSLGNKNPIQCVDCTIVRLGADA